MEDRDEESEDPRPSDQPAPPSSHESTRDFTFGSALFQFFLIPALVVIACVGLFLFFGWLVAEQKSSIDYLHDIKSGGTTRRWQSAFELAKQLNHLDKESDREELKTLVPEMVDVFQNAEGDDPRVRRYMALALGHVGDPSAVPALLDALVDDDPETRIYAIWALGAVGDARAIGPLLQLAHNDDPGIRKMVVYSLGALHAEEGRDILLAALNDDHMDVAWNAAIALAQLGDASGRDRILQMLDREFLESVSEMSEEQRVDAMVTAMKGAVLLGDPQLRMKLQDISAQDPNLKVRQAAFESLAQMGSPRQE
jgi:HEAT repeat protein